MIARAEGTVLPDEVEARLSHLVRYGSGRTIDEPRLVALAWALRRKADALPLEQRIEVFARLAEWSKRLTNPGHSYHCEGFTDEAPPRPSFRPLAPVGHVWADDQTS